MSRPHLHSSTADTQNQGNTLGERACIRQSKLFRTHESGNTMKGLLGCDNLAWKTDQTEGAYAGRRTYDHNNPYPPPSVKDIPQRHSYDSERESTNAYEYDREPQHHQSKYSHYHPRERLHDHRDFSNEHDSAHSSTTLTHRNNRINSTSSTTTAGGGNTRATMDDSRLRALAEQRVLAAVAASQVIGMGSQGHHSSVHQRIPRHGQRQQSTLDYDIPTTSTTSNINHRDYSRSSSYKPTQTSTSTRPW